MCRRFFFFFIVILPSISSLVAQFTNLKFESYSTLEGLSSSTCVEILEDSDGYLWLGTIDGLNKFDGYKFTIFRPDRNNLNSLSSNRITAITEDNNGMLWVGTSNGLNVIDRVTDRIQRIKLEEVAQGSYGQERINDLLFDAEHNELWVATYNGLIKLDLSGGLSSIHRYKYTSDPNNNLALDHSNVVSIILDSANNLWIGTEGDHLHLYQRKVDSFERFLIKVEGRYALNHIPKAFLLDGAGNFFIGNDLSRLVFWDRYENTFSFIDVGESRHVPIFHLFRDKKGYIWISTDGYGIYILDDQRKLVQHIEHNMADPYSLANNQPSYVLEASDGLFWIATYNKGVCKLALSRSVFTHLFHQSGNRNSLSSPIAQAVIQDQDKNIWIGTDGGGLNLYHEGSDRFEHFKHHPMDPASISSDKIVYLHESYDRGIWVCTWDGGLNKFNPDTKKAVRFVHKPNDPHSIGQNTVWCAVEDDQHRLWLGTQTAGLNVYDPKTGNFYRFNQDQRSGSGLISDLVFSLFIDSGNRLFVGTGVGLQVIDLNQLQPLGSGMQLPIVIFDGSSLDGIRVNHITEAHDGSIWLGTDVGLHHFNNDLKLIRSYSTENGLPNNLVVGVTVDRSNIVWTTSKSGLSRLDPLSGQFKNFNVHDGIQGLEFQSKSIFQTPDQRILAGGINGLNIFDPNSVRFEHEIVRPQITQFRIYNTVITVGDTVNGRILLDQPLNYIETLVLAFDEAYVSFDFVALYYLNPDRVEYAHRMVGANDDWVYIKGNRNATYSNLAPGNYRFEVMAVLDGNWQEAHSTGVKIQVLPPPWRTWWAYLFYIAVTMALVWLGMRYYTRMINDERAHELDQMKLRFFMNISHEFRTPLTLILNPVDKIIAHYNDPEVVKDAVSMVQRSARKLLNLVNQLLDFRKLDLGKSPLDPVKADIVKFCKDIYQSYEDLAMSRSIEVAFRSSTDTFFMWFDPDKLEKILTNLLSNAIKFTPSGGKVDVMVKAGSKKLIKDTLMRKSDKSEYLEIQVKDTGIGLKKDQLATVFDRFFHVDNTQTGTGIGLNFTKSLVEQHDGEITVESEYEKGSAFTVTLPVNSKSIDQAIKSNKEVRKSIKEFDFGVIKSLEYDLAISDTHDDNVEEEADDRVHQTILIVEDNKELRAHLKNELRGYYKIKDASNGKEGLEKALKFYPDIIVSDVMMPEMDGFEMCDQLKSNNEISHIPIILLTARSLEEDRLEGYSRGADAYLPKPFNVAVLKMRINNLLEAKRKMRERFMKQANILPSSEIATNTLDEQFLDSSTRAILDNIDNSNFSLDQLLLLVGVSRSNFYRKIQSLTGQNPSNFIRSVRLKYAAELLKQNNHTIKEVSYKTGFNSTAYFSKTFKELFDMTPNEFIKKHAEVNK